MMLLLLLLNCISLTSGVINNEASSSFVSAMENMKECTKMTMETIPIYHRDETCDRAAHNDYSRRYERSQRYEQLNEKPHIYQSLPEEIDLLCPTEDQLVGGASLVDVGLDNNWIVHNEASTPVVVIFVNEFGTETSAANLMVPPESDPSSILQPSEWMALNTFHGNLFYVRELIKESTIDGQDLLVPGRVLVTHRSGYYKVRNRFQTGPLNCPRDLSSTSDDAIIDDPEPLDSGGEDLRPEFQRTPPHSNELCNIVYQVFQNDVGCPVDAYYVGMPPNHNNITSIDGQPLCGEEFKFHLGLDDSPQDFLHDWSARRATEATFVNHSFTFRLTHDPSYVVDVFTRQPTIVQDCPDLNVRDHGNNVESLRSRNYQLSKTDGNNVTIGDTQRLMNLLSVQASGGDTFQEVATQNITLGHSDEIKHTKTQ